MKRIIIIGGMGPQASLELHRRFIKRASENGSNNGNDFPNIVHFSLPVDDFISDKTKTAAALEFIVRELKGFQFRKDDTIVIACNTAHLLQDDLEKLLRIHITSLVEVTTDHIAKHHKLVKLLASPTTIGTGLYTKRLTDANVQVLLPNNNELGAIENVIRAVIAGKEPIPITISQPTLLGCTELSCAYGNVPGTIDPLNILVDTLMPKVEVL